MISLLAIIQFGFYEAGNFIDFTVEHEIIQHVTKTSVSGACGSHVGFCTMKELCRIPKV